MNQDWIFPAGDYLCDLRVAGVMIRQGQLLVQRDADGTEFALPGGHVRVGETLEDALIREYREETGAAITVNNMLWSEECFWEWNGKKMHNLTFYYRIDLAEGALIPQLDHFVPHRDNSRVVIGWLPLEQLQREVIYPEFIKQGIHCLEDGIRHFVTYA